MIAINSQSFIRLKNHHTAFCVSGHRTRNIFWRGNYVTQRDRAPSAGNPPDSDAHASYPAYQSALPSGSTGNPNAMKAKTRRSGFLHEEVKLTDKPGSVVDSHSSRPAIAHWLKQPTRVQYGPYLMNPYLALLRVEFTVPRTVTSRAVRSYRTLSPLPDPACAGHRRFALCCTGRGLAPPRRYLAPCPMEPGLSSPPPVSPERDDDEAATVWSASARSIEGLHAIVTLHCAFLSPALRRCFARRGRYYQTRRERLHPACQCG